MAPKTKTPVEKRPRTSQDPQPYDPAFFSSKESYELYLQRFSTKDIIPGRYINFRYFETEGFSFGGWLEALGWFYICTLQETVYPRLVRHFYANLRTSPGSLKITSYVKGQRITLSPSRLRSLVGTSEDGLCPREARKWESVYGFDPWDAINMITGRNIEREYEDQEPVKPNASELTLEFRLVHHLITYIILPHGGRRDLVSHQDIFLMWCLRTGTQIDLPELIIRHMLDCWERQRSILPYGMLLTKIFYMFNVVYKTEPSSENLKLTDCYDHHTLNRMGYRKENGHWVPKRPAEIPPPVRDEGDRDVGQGERGDEEEAEQMDTEAYQFAPRDSGAGSSSAQPPPSYQDFQSYIDQRFNDHRSYHDHQYDLLNTRLDSFQDHVNTRFDNLNNQQAQIQAQQNQMHESMNAQFQQLFSYFPQPPPE